MKTSEENTSEEHWQEFVGHREDVLLEDVEIFDEYFVLSERKKGLTMLKISSWDQSDSHYIPFESETYVAGVHINPDFKSKILRFVYNAMQTPYSIIDYDMETGKQEVKKVQQVLDEGFTSRKLPLGKVMGQGPKMVVIYPFLLYIGRIQYSMGRVPYCFMAMDLMAAQ